MSARFEIGDKVRVRLSFPPGHVRTPYFIRGHTGTVTRVMGAFANPEELAYGRPGTPKQPLYWVQFHQTELWPDYSGSKDDSMVVDVYESWLETARENVQ